MKSKTLLLGLLLTGGATYAQPSPPGGVPANDLCSGAIAIACTDVVTGTTTGATATDAPTEYGTSEGVWYVLAGNDQLVTVSTCGTTSGFDTEIGVFLGECGNRLFLGNNDDDCGLLSTVTFEAWAGFNYYIYVGDYSTSTSNSNAGAFELAVTCAALPSPPNDLCADATPLDCGDAYIGSTAGANTTGQLSCANGAPGVWYSFVGDGSDYTISLDGSGYDTYLGISETCGGTCVASNDDINFGGGNYASEISGFTTTNGQTYYIYVTGYNNSVYGESGTYILNLTSSVCTPPANDLCADAAVIECGDVVSSNTEFAAAEPGLGTCGTTLGSGPGVWYAYVGTGEDVTVSTCSANTTFDTKIGVFSGQCNALTCIGGNDDDCGTRSTYSFYGEPGVSYYIYVTGYLSATGDFDLSITCNCTAEAGTLTADATPVCMSGGSATISGTHDGNSVVPTGYLQVYLLVDANGTIVGGSPTASFSVPTAGDYTIHTAVYDPLQFDPATDLAPGATVTDALAVLAGQCHAVDLIGTGVITVNPEPTATITGGGIACDGGNALFEVALTGNGPWDFTVLIDGVNPNPSTGVTTNPSVFGSAIGGTYTVDNVSDASCPGVGIGSAVIVESNTPVADFTWAQTPGTLDVDFTNTGSGGPTWSWDFDDDATEDATTEDGSFTYPAPGVYDAYLTVTNACGSDQAMQTITVVPTNDLCDNAIAISCGQTLAGSTTTATQDIDPNIAFCGTDVSTSAGVWYEWVSDGSIITVSTCDQASYDTKIAVFTGTCGSLSCVNGIDDSNGQCTGFTSLLEDVPTVSGETYYIYVSGFNNATGTFSVSLTCVAPPPAPANDNVCDAIGLSLGINGPYTNVGATVEVGEVSPGAGTGVNTCESQDGWCDFELALDNTIWFTFVAPASGNVSISTDGSDDDTQIAVYSATGCQELVGGTSVTLGANDDNPDFVTTQFSSLLILCGLTPGETYYLQVDGYEGAAGDVLVTLTELTLDASFTFAALNLDVDFTDASTASGTITDWAWDFDDSNTSSDQNPSHSFAADGAYNVCLTVTDNNGCESTHCEIVQVADITISIAEAVERGMEVYPNPSNGQFVVEVKGVEADVQIIVMDLSGRQVYTEGVTLNGNFRKDLNLDVAKGSYLLQVATLEGLVTRKIQVH